MNFLTAHEIIIDCIVDNGSNKWGLDIEGKVVRSAKEIDFSTIDVVIITPVDEDAVKLIHNQLRDLGLGEDSVIINYTDYRLIMLEEEQYFDSNIIKLRENGVFIDAGVLNLNTSMRYIKECEKNNIKNFRIYAFEPDSALYKQCIEIMEDMKNVDLQLYNRGLER